MAIDIRKATPGDVPAIIELLRDFAEFEKLSEFCTVTEELLHDAMFGRAAFVQGIIAYDKTRATGYALFYPNFLSFRGRRGVFLEDLYIGPQYRGMGVGKAMLKAVAAAAKEQGCERLDFLVLDWNKPAIDFYESLGAVRDGEDRHYKFTDDAFMRLAS